MGKIISQDILVDETNDLLISEGDFVINLSDAQHLQHMMQASNGDYEDVLLGVNAISNTKKANTAKNRDTLNSNIRGQLDYDEWNLERLNTDDLSDITINAEKNNNQWPGA